MRAHICSHVPTHVEEATETLPLLHFHLSRPKHSWRQSEVIPSSYWQPPGPSCKRSYLALVHTNFSFGLGKDSLEGHPMLSRLYLRNNPLGIHGLTLESFHSGTG